MGRDKFGKRSDSGQCLAGVQQVGGQHGPRPVTALPQCPVSDCCIVRQRSNHVSFGELTASPSLSSSQLVQQREGAASRS